MYTLFAGPHQRYLLDDEENIVIRRTDDGIEELTPDALIGPSDIPAAQIRVADLVEWFRDRPDATPVEIAAAATYLGAAHPNGGAR